MQEINRPGNGIPPNPYGARQYYVPSDLAELDRMQGAYPDARQGGFGIPNIAMGYPAYAVGSNNLQDSQQQVENHMVQINLNDESGYLGQV